ncbi:hypothetical protein HPB52_005395 [Rhipicephalus sanguineus]|uniref:DDE Tnp4 domain-containing protein n=1 Tax=Rhipicephalus sanguineus TaxID=34632 RepID=A0A9D4SZI8_RHISA|nr:hypothetical protein HPB52_005395 [Rhipicephalus sanguineus]
MSESAVTAGFRKAGRLASAMPDLDDESSSSDSVEEAPASLPPELAELFQSASKDEDFDMTFVSEAYGGRTSDTHITIESGFLNRIEPGDVVVADKGFPGIKAPVEGNRGIVVLGNDATRRSDATPYIVIRLGSDHRRKPAHDPR